MRVFLRLTFAATLVIAAFAQRDLPSYVTREVTFQHANSVQQFKEIKWAIQSIGQLPFVNIMETAGRISFRGPRENLPVSEWLVKQLDRPHPTQLPAASEITQTEPHPYGEDRAQVFHLAHVNSPEQLQDVATLLRRVALIRYVAAYTEGRAVAIRGTEEQMKFAAWLLSELDREPGKSASTGTEFRTRDRKFEYGVRVFATRSVTPEMITDIKKIAGSWTYAYSALPAIVVQTTDDRMESVRKLIQEKGW